MTTRAAKRNETENALQLDEARSNRVEFTRRKFLQASAPALAFAVALDPAIMFAGTQERAADDYILTARNRLLMLVNEERSRTGLSRLVLDDLACRVATQHAVDMVDGQFLSHWGRDGRKPYHRYSFSGGTEAVQENVSSADNVQSLSSASLVADLIEMHTRLFEETPPNDGHRRTILQPWHTHVGFGIALRNYSLRLDELYLSRYVEINFVRTQANAGATIPISGKLLDQKHVLAAADVYYEPLPAPPSIAWLRTPRPWGLPEVRVTLRPKLPRKSVYVDGTTGVIEREKAAFWFPVVLSQPRPGIYTVLLWVARSKNDEPFPAAEICVRAE
jgi:uncharacterized protein YkwD